MKRIVANKTTPYAYPGRPDFPNIQLVAGEELDVPDLTADSVVANGHGRLVESDNVETPSVQPESKDKGLKVESKEQPEKAKRGRKSKTT